MMPQRNGALSFDTFVTPPIPVVTNDLPPGQSMRAWSPITATLISGERDAALVDALMTMEQGRDRADWIAGAGKNLTTIYVTHSHGDHWFGSGVIQERYPGVRLVALPGVIEQMRRQISPSVFNSFWSRFPGQIQPGLMVAEPIPRLRIELEGNELIAVDTGHTDTDHTTVLYVPSIDLVVAGDVVYNDVHVYLAESDHDTRMAWIRALDAIEALSPRAVVAGHKRAGRSDDPRILEETRAYIRDFDRIAGFAGSAVELYQGMLRLHPDRVNPGALWSSAQAANPRAPCVQAGVKRYE